ncbi:MAG: PDZ domain-containing protein [Phycisphaerae bacterium]
MRKQAIAAMAMLVLAFPVAAGAADVEKLMADVSARTANAIAILQFRISQNGQDLVGGGQAVCIDPAGTFVTTFLDQAMKPEMIKEMKLFMPGRDGKTYDATLLGVDPITGLGFVQTGTGTPVKQGDLAAIEFVEKPSLAVGQQVVSVGVNAGDGNHTTYLGLANISAILRVPNPLVYVTGGKLTAMCSPVFGADGKAIGLVMRQAPLAYCQLNTKDGPITMPVRSDDETAFFTPSDEFFGSLKKENIPKAGEVKRLGWMGITSYLPVAEAVAKAQGFELPAVMCDEVIEKEPAALAGMKKSDIIIEVNGQKLEKLANPNMVVPNFMRQIIKFQVGQKVELTIMRGATKMKVNLTVSKIPKLPEEADKYVDRALGMLLRERVPLDQYLLPEKLRDKEGMIVIFVQKQTLADLYGLKPGDIVTHVNDQAVKNPAAYDAFAKDFFKAQPPAQPQPVKLTIWREDKSISVTILPPRPN